MRLLRNEGEDQFGLTEFIGQNIPPYAILSHTWGPDHDEVTFQDIVNNTGQDKVGYQKIRYCGNQATKDGLQYFWVDTCCIDKSSSAELTESINSMFQWYKTAVVCYVALGDLDSDCVHTNELPRCRWFGRGWTLQELLAPAHVQFYDRTWVYIGSKETLVEHISAITGIPKGYLVGKTLASASVAMKMSWAARRETKRIEDRAYSLLGIFDVNMPLIYGEGMKAFRRLQEEIIKYCNDLTIFAWETQADMRQQLVSPLATSPEEYAASYDIHPFADDFAEFSITNKGLLLSSDIPLRTVESSAPNGGHVKVYSIYLGIARRTIGGIYLRKIGPNLFCRNGHLAQLTFENTALETRMYEVSETCILLNTVAALDAAKAYRTQETLWDQSDRIFLRPKRYIWADFSMVLVMTFNVTLGQGTSPPLAVLCYQLNYGPQLKIFVQEQYPEEFDMITQARYRQDGIHVQELDVQARSTRIMTNSTTIRAGHVYHNISVSLHPQSIQTFVGSVQVSTLCFNVDGKDI